MMEDNNLTDEFLRMYGFSEDLRSLLRKSKGIKTESVAVGSQLSAKKIQKLVQNQRGTLRVVIFGERDMVLTNGKSTASTSLFSYEWNRPVDHLQELQEGDWLLREGGSQAYLVRDEDIRDFGVLWERWYKLHMDYNQYPESSRIKDIPKRAVVDIQELRRYVSEWQRLAEEMDDLNAIDEERKQEALSKVSIRGDSTNYTFEFTSLENKRYTLEVKAEGTRMLTTDHIIDLIWKNRYYKVENEDDSTRHYNHCIGVTPWNSVTVRREGREARLRRTRSAGGATLMYFNGKIVAEDFLRVALQEYLDTGKFTKVVKEKQHPIAIAGIKGVIKDLEGSWDVNLSVEKIGKRWYLTFLGEKYHMAGGITKLEELQRVAEGQALKWEARHSTKEFIKRLIPILGSEKRALKLVDRLKKMAVLTGVIGK